MLEDFVKLLLFFEIEAVSQIIGQIYVEPRLSEIAAAKFLETRFKRQLKFGNRLFTFNVPIFNFTAVHRLAIVFF
jgi:hypothetical protein